MFLFIHFYFLQLRELERDKDRYRDRDRFRDRDRQRDRKDEKTEKVTLTKYLLAVSLRLFSTTKVIYLSSVLKQTVGRYGLPHCAHNRTLKMFKNICQ